MKIRKQKTIALLIAFCLLPLVAFYFSYLQAEYAALRYLKVLQIYDNISFQQNKAEMYKLTGNKVFLQAELKGKYPKLEYKVNRIGCKEIKGFSSFVFQVNLTIRGFSEPLSCLIHVEKEKIIDAYRED